MIRDWGARLLRRDTTTTRYSRDGRWPPPSLPADLLGRCPDCHQTPTACLHMR